MINKDLQQFSVYFTEGRTAVGHGTGTYGLDATPCVYVSFQQLKNPNYKIGSSAKGEAMVGPRIQMIFKNPDSIDVIIKALKACKKDLKNDKQKRNEKALDTKA